MREYIEREELIKAVEGNPFVTISVKSYVRCSAKAIPAAAVRPVVHGEWIDRGSLSCRCSECGCKSDRESNYCPNCGADMRGPTRPPAPTETSEAEREQFARRVGREETT